MKKSPGKKKAAPNISKSPIKDKAAFQIIDHFLSQLTRKARGPIPEKWVQYFGDGVSRHALAYALKRYSLRVDTSRSRGRPIHRTSAFYQNLLSAVNEHKAKLASKGVQRPTDRAALERYIRHTFDGRSISKRKIRVEVAYWAKRVSEARRELKTNRN